MKINNFWGDLSSISAKTATLNGTPRCRSTWSRLIVGCVGGFLRNACALFMLPPRTIWRIVSPKRYQGQRYLSAVQEWAYLMQAMHEIALGSEHVYNSFLVGVGAFFWCLLQGVVVG